MMAPSQTGPGRDRAATEGSVLIVALWTLMVLALLVISMAFDMRIEAEIASHIRKRTKAQYLAQAGVEWAKVLMTKHVEMLDTGELRVNSSDDPEMIALAHRFQHLGMGFTGHKHELGEGHFNLSILPEPRRWNINVLAMQAATDESARCILEELLDQAEVPPELYDELIDCLIDWIDADDLHRVNGAESDDSFYKERGYKVKNAPLETVDELRLIKGWTDAIVYGGPNPNPDDPPMLGVAQKLTVWGEGKIDVNDAGDEELLAICEMDELVLEDIKRLRLGLDGKEGTLDDGIKDLNQVAGMKPEIAKWLTVRDTKFVRLVSIGEVQGVRAGIWAVLQVSEGQITPLYWREEPMD
ncbi:MAG: type II secretion system protein GspK [Kiritimatiellae bacterium]|nr:type II secretion system protein GspK [Kiritimatiellia bacterium]MDW8459490.1 type II secretion system protein GspK [Verrucomicrobiota bacterium]